MKNLKLPMEDSEPSFFDVVKIGLLIMAKCVDLSDLDFRDPRRRLVGVLESRLRGCSKL